MDKTFRNILIIIAVIVVGAALFYGGMIYSRMNTWYGGYGMMGNGSVPYQSNNDQKGYYGPGGMMNDHGYGGMMNGGGYGGMMGGYGSLYGVEPLSVEDAHQAVEDYLSSFGK